MDKKSVTSEKKFPILIVSEDQKIAKSLNLLLEPYYKCSIVHDLKDDVIKVQREKPVLAIVDLVGIKEDCERYIRELQKEDILVHLLTDQKETNLEIANLIEISDDFSVKPIDSEELLSKIKSLLHLKEIETKVQSQHKKLFLIQEGLISEKKKDEYERELIDDYRDFIVEMKAKMHKKNRELEEAYINLQNRSEELLKTKDYLEKVLVTTPSGLFTVDLNRIITSWNKTAEKITGFKAEETIGKECTILRGSPCPDECGLYAEDEEKPIFGTECSVIAKNGKKMILLKNVDYLRDEKGEIIGGVEIFEDITDRKRMEQELEERAVELTRLNKEMEEFVYITSHDMRSPLISVEAYMHRLLDDYKEVLSKEAINHVERIWVNIEFMNNLISSMLDLSRITTQKAQYETVDFYSLVKMAISELEPRIREKNIEVFLDEDMPEIYCDKIRINQVLTNLIGNAIKFMGETPDPRIEVGYNDEEKFHEFYVKDSGIGIAEEFHEFIFKPMQRLKEIEADGAGMGLTITKKIVESHGGSIWIESKEGKGSTFYFTLPKKDVTLNEG